MRIYYHYCKQYKWQFIVGSLFKMIEAIAELFVPIVMAGIMDIGIANGDKPFIFYSGLILLAIAFGGLLVACIAQYLASVASQGFGTHLRNAMFAHISSLSFFEIDKFNTSSLITRLSNDTQQMQHAVAMTIRLALRVPFVLFGSVVMAFILNPRLATVFVVASPIIGISIYLIMKFSAKFFRQNQQNVDRLTSVTKENLEGARVVRAFANEEIEKARFEKFNEDSKKVSIKAAKVSALMNPAVTVIVNASILAVLYFGSRMIDNGSLLQGKLFAFINYITQISLSLMVLANLTLVYTKAIASTKRVSEVIEEKPSITYPNASPEKQTSATIFDVVDLTFSYANTSQPALSNINFSIKSGSVFGIIGGTGSGKSTLVNLLARLYDVSSGSILYFGNDIKLYSAKDLRKDISIVPQSPVLFSGKLRDNLIWRGETSDEDMLTALKTSQILNFVEMSGGLDMQIEQGGKNLSGGQRQRLSIARALVSNPSVIILDDSSSALDFHTDSLLQKALKADTNNATIIVISQRATSIKHASQILVLDQGRQVGLGTHKSLYSNCEVYREICDSQVSKDDIKTSETAKNGGIQ